MKGICLTVNPSLKRAYVSGPDNTEAVSSPGVPLNADGFELSDVLEEHL